MHTNLTRLGLSSRLVIVFFLAGIPRGWGQSAVPPPSPPVAQTSFATERSAEDDPPQGKSKAEDKNTLPSPKTATNGSATDKLPAPAKQPPTVLALDELIQFAVANNPRLARATLSVEIARGRKIQAGLYPNPILSITGDELGDRTGPGGIWTAPQFTQEIVTGKKLQLSQAVAAKEMDHASLGVLTERYALIGSIRSQYLEVVILQRRVELLGELVKLAEQSVANGKKLFAGGAIPKLDILQFEVELERVRVEKESAESEIPGAFRRLAATVGAIRIPQANLQDLLALPLPGYDLEAVREIVIQIHPEVRQARVGIERAQLALRRAQVDPVPNVTLTTGYTRQNQNRSDDWMVGVSLPIPVWNRNQGGIISAQAEFRSASFEVARVENDLSGRIATAFRSYLPARTRAERYTAAIIPKAEEAYQLSADANKGGQFEYLRVIQAQRSLFEARLRYVESLGEAWRESGTLSGLLLEEVWPPTK